MNKDLPLYDINIDGKEGLGMFKISIVDKPAIMEGFLAFNENKEIKFQATDEEKKQVVGPLLIPDSPIYRRNEKIGEYYVRFSAETIEQIVYKYSKDGFFNMFNLEHQYDTDAVVMLEMWIKESDIDKSDEYGFDLPVGTLFMKAQIEDENLWEAIKNKEFNGFSIEINADIKKVNEMTEFQFGEMFGEFKVKLQEQVNAQSEDQKALTELVLEMAEEIAELKEMLSSKEEATPEEVVELTEEAPAEEVVEEPVAEEVAEEAPAEEVVEEEVKEELSEEENEVSEEEAELQLSAEQEDVAEVEEPKVLEFKQIDKSKVNLIDNFFGKRLY
jgi:hypothetical protein